MTVRGSTTQVVVAAAVAAVAAAAAAAVGAVDDEDSVQWPRWWGAFNGGSSFSTALASDYG